jgi:hypothetical protein
MARVRRALIKQRAHGRCEYCQLVEECTVLPHQIDHVRATKHHGPTTMANTCLPARIATPRRGRMSRVTPERPARFEDGAEYGDIDGLGVPGVNERGSSM